MGLVVGMLNMVQSRSSVRRGYSLRIAPPRLFKPHRSGRGAEVAIFEPYEENLPLESGFYTFVLDQDGRLRIRRGNSSSHAQFVNGAPIGAAGHFRINRAGNVAELVCQSFDYRCTIRGENDPLIAFVIDSFLNHHALEVSPFAVFRFAKGLADNLWITHDRKVLTVDELVDFQERLTNEGQGDVAFRHDNSERIIAFATYTPIAPLRLYTMHRDQLMIEVEHEDDAVFETSAGQSPLTPTSPPLTSGRKAFVIDRAGWLVIGHGHHILSGGQPVGAAGQIVLDDHGLVDQINLNFSGHYRPDLDAEYARYTYRSLARHPLLSVAQTCRISGRKFDDENVASTVLEFTASELLTDDPDLDFAIETAML